MKLMGSLSLYEMKMGFRGLYENRKRDGSILKLLCACCGEGEDMYRQRSDILSCNRGLEELLRCRWITEVDRDYQDAFFFFF